ncbi:MAG TPA: hypothetical protein VFW31_14035 [Candidatus Angelobacter sp.]|nr:hypothetical protein [Candidatus Angelobacter sp.]
MHARNIKIPKELSRYESGLREWIGRCSLNAMWYLADPIGAIREARLGVDEELLEQLEWLVSGHTRYAQQLDCLDKAA